jgi:hypothetical protein
MAILTVDLHQLLALTGTNRSTMRSDKRDGEAVAAFGVRQPIVEDRFLALDAVAMLVRDDLQAAGMKRKIATNTTLAFWPEWVECVARIEYEKAAWLFSVAEVEARQWWAAAGPALQLPAFIAKLPQQHVPRRLLTVNVARILSDIHKRAKRSRLDLSAGRFTLPPDHPTMVEWIAEVRQRREASQRGFDPAKMREPPRPAERWRKAIAEAAWALQ